jgi:hypothetical protein
MRMRAVCACRTVYRCGARSRSQRPARRLDTPACGPTAVYTASRPIITKSVNETMAWLSFILYIPYVRFYVHGYCTSRPHRTVLSVVTSGSAYYYVKKIDTDR